MTIESLRLRNFKSFQDAALDTLPSFAVVVGANGTGMTATLEP